MGNKIKAHIVVGAGYGDEGKGITTDYLCSQSKNSIVIRYSGGQQAGHTVVHNGIKHIHSNYGSGTLRGVPSYFSEHTVFYPTTILRELQVFKEKGINPRLTFHPLAKLTTPYDVFENIVDSKNRSDGTCGLGIGKTMKRSESPYKLYAVDLLNPVALKKKVENIGKHYYNTFVTSDEEQTKLQMEMDDFNDALKLISWEIRNYDYLTEYDNLIFEGSQGILLDMDHGIFPNVTYANTTSKNAHNILDKLNIVDRDVYYITRAYSTRHGSGPFMEEEVPLINNEGEINVFNEYQKEFKVANIDYDKLNYALAIDDIYSNGKATNKNLVVTCLDQLEDFKFKYTNLATPFYKLFESYSPDSKDFKLKQTNYFENN